MDKEICKKCGKTKEEHFFGWGEFWCNKSSSGKDGLDRFILNTEGEKR